MSYFLVDPQSVLTWSHDWSDFLDYASPADEIASRQWTITPDNDASSPTTPNLTNATQEIVTAQGFVAGKVYHLTEHITTTAGLQDERSIILRCENT